MGWLGAGGLLFPAGAESRKEAERGFDRLSREVAGLEQRLAAERGAVEAACALLSAPAPSPTVLPIHLCFQLEAST